MARNTYFDRSGTPITLERWSELFEDNSYRFVQRTWVIPNELEVVTMWNGFDPYRVDFRQEPARIFYVSELHWKSGKLGDVHERLVASEAEAAAAHESLVASLRARRRATN